MRTFKICEIWGSRRGVDEVCALLGCYAAYVGSFLFTDVTKKDIGTIFKSQGIDRFTRNVGKLQTYAA